MIADLTTTSAPATTVTGEAEAVLAWLQHSDENAAAWLVAQFRPLVRAIALRKMPSPSLADDVVQDTFSRAFVMLHRYDTARPFNAWLARITRNICFDKLRTLARRNETSLDEIEPDTLPAPDASRSAEIRNARQTLHALFASMRSDDREIIILRYLRGLSARAVAEKLGISAGNVALRAMRARRTLATRARELRALSL